MAINYVDLVDGDDDTGTGAWDNPYLTVNKACDGLSGGDEVRVEKSDAHSSLTGTFEVTNGSTTVGTSNDQTSALAQYNHVHFINDPDWIWYEVASVTSTQVTLREKYGGATRITTAEEMTYIDAGDLGTTTVWQQVASTDDGTSKSSRLKISGGWTLSASPAQDGETYIKQTGTAYDGYCFDVDGDFVEISSFYMYRFRSSIQCDSDIIGCRFDDLVGGDSGNNCFYFNGRDHEIGTVYVTMSQASTGVNVQCKISEFEKIVCFYCDDPVVYIYKDGNYFKDIEIKGVTGTTDPYGVFFNGADNVRIGKLSITNLDASQSSIVSLLASTNFSTGFIGELIHDGDCDYIAYADGGDFGDIRIGKITDISPGTAVTSGGANYSLLSYPPMLSIQQWGDDPDDSRMYWSNDVGYAVKDSTDARSDYCIKVTPNSLAANYYMDIPLGAVRVSAQWQNIDLKVYLKDDVSFNGNVYLAAFAAGGIRNEAGWAEVTPTTSYVEHTVTVSWRDLVPDQYVELWARIYGDAGNVFFDDFSSSESAEGSTTTTTTTSSTTTTTTSSSTTTTTTA